MKTTNQIFHFRFLAVLLMALIIVSCDDEDEDNGVAPPSIENEVEVITDVSLIFTPEEGEAIVANAVDSDGEGIGSLQVLDPITLDLDTQYTLTYTILNALNPDDIEDIGAEILEEDNEHQFFYMFSSDVFASPMGEGNIDSPNGVVNYLDEDENGLDVGLMTSWTTPETPAAGMMFRTRLQHQPDLKSAATGANDGDTDFDLTFILNIQ